MAKVAPLSAQQLRALARLSKMGLLDAVYLAGGSGIAIHLEHRLSNDLDLFSNDREVDMDRMRRDFVEALGAEVVSQSDATLTVRVAGAMIDVVRYPYARLGRSRRGPEGVSVASLRDLAAMKLAAIARRGVQRDYWDLYEILTRSRLTLHAVCDDYLRKFGVAEADIYHVLRALNWFEEAESGAPMPRGLTHAKWKRIRTWFETQVPRELARRA